MIFSSSSANAGSISICCILTSSGVWGSGLKLRLHRVPGRLQRVELVDPAEILREARHLPITSCELRAIRQMQQCISDPGTRAAKCQTKWVRGWIECSLGSALSMAMSLCLRTDTYSVSSWRGGSGSMNVKIGEA